MYTGFILPADWITLIYYSIGIMQISYIVSDLLAGRSSIAKKDHQELRIDYQISHSASVIGFGVLFLAIGVLLTYGNKLFTRNAVAPTRGQLIQLLQKNRALTGTSLTDSDIEHFLLEDNAVLLGGQALYPSFFAANTGVLNYYWRSFESKPYDRLVFYMIGAQSLGVVLPIETKSLSLPDGADVIVLGCKTENGDIEALSVLVTSTDQPILYAREPFPELTCPFPQ